METEEKRKWKTNKTDSARVLNQDSFAVVRLKFFIYNGVKVHPRKWISRWVIFKPYHKTGRFMYKMQVDCSRFSEKERAP